MDIGVCEMVYRNHEFALVSQCNDRPTTRSKVQDLAHIYAKTVTDFIHQHQMRENKQASIHPYFLFVSFSHVHQLCAPRNQDEPKTCQWASNKNRKNS